MINLTTLSSCTINYLPRRKTLLYHKVRVYVVKIQVQYMQGIHTLTIELIIVLIFKNSRSFLAVMAEKEVSLACLGVGGRLSQGVAVGVRVLPGL